MFVFSSIVFLTPLIWTYIQYLKILQWLGFNLHNPQTNKTGIKKWNKIVHSFEHITNPTQYPAYTTWEIKRNDLFITNYISAPSPDPDNKDYKWTTTIILGQTQLFCVPNFLKPTTAELADYKFISVEYIFTDEYENTQIIPLKIPNELYYKDNILFTKTFVLWCLYNQPAKYDFNGIYQLQIIDQNANLVQIDHTQRILLNKSDYLIVNENKYSKHP